MIFNNLKILDKNNQACVKMVHTKIENNIEAYGIGPVFKTIVLGSAFIELNET